MWTDPIVDELHKIRFAHAEKFNYDLDAIFNDLKKHESKNRQRVVSLPIKRRPLMRETSEIQKVRKSSVKVTETEPALMSRI